MCVVEDFANCDSVFFYQELQDTYNWTLFPFGSIATVIARFTLTSK